MAYAIEIPDDAQAAAAADILVQLYDGSTPLGMTHKVYVPSAAGTNFGPDARTGWRTLGTGYVSTAANNVLNVNLSFALTASSVLVNVAGREE